MGYLIAGFLLARSGRVEHIGYGAWLRQKALRLLTPYFVLSAAALIPKYALEHGGFQGLTLSYVAAAFFAPRQNVWGHFWWCKSGSNSGGGRPRRAVRMAFCAGWPEFVWSGAYFRHDADRLLGSGTAFETVQAPGVGFYQPVCVYILYLFLAGTGGCGTSRQPFSRAVVHSDPGDVRRRRALPCDSDLGLPQMQFSAL